MPSFACNTGEVGTLATPSVVHWHLAVIVTVSVLVTVTLVSFVACYWNHITTKAKVITANVPSKENNDQFTMEIERAGDMDIRTDAGHFVLRM